MFNRKRNIAILVGSITIVLLIILTVILSPKSKQSGGYSDTLESNNIVTRIISTTLSKEKDKTMIEVSTSVWNKGNEPIEVKSSNFNLNNLTPSNDINITVQKNERINIRQVYEYNGPVTLYQLNLKGIKFNFDFTLKNNELQNKNLKLVANTTDATKENLEKQQAEAEKNREAEAKNAEEEKKKLEKEAEKKKEEAARNPQPTPKTNLFGKYHSQTNGDTTSFVINEDYSANIHIACDATVSNVFIQKLSEVKVNETKSTFTGEYKLNDKTEGISFSIENNTLSVIYTTKECLKEARYIK